jgi:hypothetical protein
MFLVISDRNSVLTAILRLAFLQEEMACARVYSCYKENSVQGHATPANNSEDP